MSKLRLGRVKRRLHEIATLQRFALRHRSLASVIKRVKAKHLTYLDTEPLVKLARLAMANERRGLEGIMIEAGCAMGGSALVLASAKARERPLYVYDAFGMIPPPSDHDGQDAHERYAIIKGGHSPGIGGDLYYGYQENLYETVTQIFEDFSLALEANNIHLIKGFYQHTLHLTAPVVLAHIDCDWYDSVMTCLERITPRLVRRGVLVIDDYSAWSGCKRAVDEYFDGKSGYQFKTKSRLHVAKM
jgi:hypothetical protein